jgi:hypothetical protein
MQRLPEPIGMIVGMLAGALLIPFILVAKLFGRGVVDLSPSEVAVALRDGLEGGVEIFEEFEKSPISDPRLNAIRLEARKLRWPLNEASREKLRQLIFEVESIGS